MPRGSDAAGSRGAVPIAFSLADATFSESRHDETGTLDAAAGPCLCWEAAGAAERICASGMCGKDGAKGLKFVSQIEIGEAPKVCDTA